MQRSVLCWICAATSGVASTAASAAITVTGDGGASIPSSWYDITTEPDGSFTVTLVEGDVSGTTIFEIRGGATDDINALLLSFDEDTGDDITVEIREDAVGTRIRDVRLIDNTDLVSASLYIGAVEIAGDLGDIRDAVTLDGVDVLGDLTGDIDMHIDAGIPGSGSIGAMEFGGDIANVNITALSTIGSITADQIGSAPSAAIIFADGGIDAIDASGSVFAIIDARDSSGDGGIRSFKAASFDGTMKIQHVTPADVTPGIGTIEITGNLNGDILIDEDFTNFSPFLDPNGIGRTLTIKTGAGGLKGQVVINNENGGHDWADGAKVQVGTTVITNPEYTNPASALGGGSAGEAAFKLHDESCDPASGGSVTDNGSNITAKLRHYGPIQFSSTPAGVDVWDDSTSQWLALSSSDYTFAVDSADDRTLKVTEKGGATHGFRAGFTYRVRPTSNLLSSGVSGTPAVVHNADYTFSVTSSGGGCTTCLCSTDPDCPMGGMLMGGGPDFNQNGVVDSSDLEWTIKAIGQNGGRFDLNNDGIVDATDVAIVTAAVGSHPAK